MTFVEDQKRIVFILRCFINLAICVHLEVQFLYAHRCTVRVKFHTDFFRHLPHENSKFQSDTFNTNFAVGKLQLSAPSKHFNPRRRCWVKWSVVL